jgi:hypothetical protein
MGGAYAAFGTLASDADIDITYQKAAYVALNIAALGLPAYKANSMGLWPSTADFLYGEPFDPVCTVYTTVCCPGFSRPQPMVGEVQHSPRSRIPIVQRLEMAGGGMSL